MNGIFGIPGQSNAHFASLTDLLWGGDESRVEVLRSSAAAIDATARDAGNTPTTTLRAGLLLTKGSNGKLTEYDPAEDSQSGSVSGDGDLGGVYGVLPVDVPMLDENGVAVDRYVPIIVSAPVKSDRLLIQGDPLIGHAYEDTAIESLLLKFFRLSSELC